VVVRSHVVSATRLEVGKKRRRKGKRRRGWDWYNDDQLGKIWDFSTIPPPTPPLEPQTPGKGGGKDRQPKGGRKL